VINRIKCLYFSRLKTSVEKIQWYHFPFHFRSISISWRWNLVIPVKDASESAFENTALPRNPRIHSTAVGPAVIAPAMMNRGAKNSAEFSGAGEDMSVCPIAHYGLAEM
jgi:hypothetical protein